MNLSQVFVTQINAFMLFQKLLQPAAWRYESTITVPGSCADQQKNQFGFLKKLSDITHWHNNMIVSDDRARQKTNNKQ